jgi:UDP-N-acetylglucosamine acyltransferase
MNIHKTAIVSQGAKISQDVEIGPYCVIGENVILESGVKLHSHVCISGRSKIGENTEIFPFASIGYEPQDLKYQQEDSEVIVGKNNKIREYVTINAGTKLGGMKTVVGDNGLFMIGSHIAHDCVVGNNVILANNATLGGHVVLGDNVIIGGLAAVHQHVRIGSFAIVGGVSAVVNDVVPFASVSGDRAKILGMNVVGMKRNNFDRSDIDIVRDAFKIIFYKKDMNFNERLALLREAFDNKKVDDLVEFFASNTKRSYCMPPILKD